MRIRNCSAVNFIIFFSHCPGGVQRKDLIEIVQLEAGLLSRNFFEVAQSGEFSLR